jgi:deoxyribodipyrimidine photolyase-related protein
MSNFCNKCHYDPKLSTGERACPFTTLYWDFLNRHYEKLKNNPRLRFQLRHVEEKRKKSYNMLKIIKRADELKKKWNV